MSLLRRILAYFIACGQYGIVEIGALDVIAGPCMRRAYHSGPHQAMGLSWEREP